MSQETKVVVCAQCGKKFQLAAEFDAASFQCKGCGATVWVKKKPTEVPSARKRRSGGGGRARGGARSPSAGKGRAGASAKRGHARQEESVEEERPGRARYQKKKDNTPMIIGGVSVVALAIVGILVMSNKKDEVPAAKNSGKTMTGTTVAVDEPADAGADPTAAGGAAAAAKTNTGAGATGAAATGTGGATDTGAAKKGTGEDVPPEPTRKLGGGSKRSYKRSKTSKWDAPVDIPHLKETTKEEREEIDTLVTTMMDPDMGIDSMRAKDQLVILDKKAFPRVLAAMARIRDTMTDVDSLEERLIESSLRLGDSCLREMDGFLNHHAKPDLRPGTTKRYTSYILRLHYKRWMKELSKLPKMPGPFDPSTEFDEPENFQGR